LAKKLIKKGIDFTCKAKDGLTPALLAQKFNHVAFVAFIDIKIKEQAEAVEKHMQQLKDEEAVLAPAPVKWMYTPQSNQTTTPEWNQSYTWNGKSPPLKRGPRRQSTLDQYGFTNPVKSKGWPISPPSPGITATGKGFFGTEYCDDCQRPLNDCYCVTSNWGTRNGNSPMSVDSDFDSYGRDDEGPDDNYSPLLTRRRTERFADPDRFVRQRTSREYKVQLLDENGDAIDDENAPILETVVCVKCDTLEANDRIFCSSCNYVLHGKCPDCKTIIDFEPFCPVCSRCMWETSVETALKPKAELKHLTFDGKYCNFCYTDQTSAFRTYCEQCLYIMNNQCPHCLHFGVWGNPDCYNCHRSLKEDRDRYIIRVQNAF
jgi:hypothetical protein